MTNLGSGTFKLTAGFMWFGLVGSSGVVAQPTSEQAAAIRSACPTDYRTYCAQVPAGGEASLKCLQANVAKLSSACQSAVNAATGTPAQSKAAPAAPAAAPQQPAQSSSPAPAKPAAASQAPAAPATNAAPLTPRQELFLVRNACRVDFRKLCENVPLGGGRGVACLEARKAALSPNCVSAIREVRGQ
jgi:hypothetical protein